MSLVVAGLAWWAGAATAAFPGRNGRLVYLGTNYTMHTVSSDGGDDRVIWQGTNSMGAARPSWSPDGRRIAFGSQGRVWVMNADGGDLRPVTGSGRDLLPSWSPDGTQLIYVHIVGSGGSARGVTYVVGVDGSDPQPLFPTSPCSEPLGACSPVAAWSAAGRIALVSDRGGDPELWTMNPDGSAPVQITSIPSRDQSVASARPNDFDWSPDGTRLAFSRVEYGALSDFEHLFVVNSDGGNLTDLTDAVGGIGNGCHQCRFAHPGWSPDGTRIVIGRHVGDSNLPSPVDLFSVNPDGSGLAQITVNGFSVDADWQPLPGTAQAGPTLAPKPRLTISRRRTAISRRGIVTIRLRCAVPGPGNACTGTLRLVNAHPSPCLRRRIQLGAAGFRIRARHTAGVRVRISRARRSLLRCRHALPVRAVVTVVRAGGGPPVTFKSSLTLSARR